MGDELERQNLQFLISQKLFEISKQNFYQLSTFMKTHIVQKINVIDKEEDIRTHKLLLSKDGTHKRKYERRYSSSGHRTKKNFIASQKDLNNRSFRDKVP